MDCRDGAATHGVGCSIISGQLINADQHAPALLSVTPRVWPHEAFETAATFRRLPPIAHYFMPPCGLLCGSFFVLL